MAGCINAGVGLVWLICTVVFTVAMSEPGDGDAAGAAGADTDSDATEVADDDGSQSGSEWAGSGTERVMSSGEETTSEYREYIHLAGVILVGRLWLVSFVLPVWLVMVVWW